MSTVQPPEASRDVSPEGHQNGTRPGCLLPVLVLCILAGIAYFITKAKPEASQGSNRQPDPLLVEVLELNRQDYAIQIPSYGLVEPADKVELHSKLTAEVLWVSPDLKVGKFVEKGQVLLKLDPFDFEIALQEAKSALAAAELALAEERARSRQAAREWSKELNSEPETDFALRKPQLQAALASLETAKAQLQLAQSNLDKTQIRSNFSGRLERVEVNRGMVIGSGALVAQGYETAFAEVRLPVSNESLRLMSPPSTKNPVRVAFRSGSERWQGTIERAEAGVDSQSQQLHWVARIEAPFESKSERRALLVGEYLEANIEGRTLNQVVVIPSKAIYQGQYVYVVEEGALQRRDLSITWRGPKEVLVSSGLEQGDLLVTTSLGQVSSGTKVKVLDAEVLENKAQGASL